MGRILLLFERGENRRLIGDWLKETYEVIVGEDASALEAYFDLCIMDGAALELLWEDVLAKKESARRAYLPFLLIADPGDTGLVTRHLWKTVDDLLWTPMDKAELQARVEILLCTRKCSMESGENYLALAHASPLGAFIEQDGRIVYMNPAFGLIGDECGLWSIERWLGAAPSISASPGFLDLLDSVDRDRISECFEAVSSGRTPRASCEARVGSHGSERWWELHVSPITHNGRPALVGVTEDITHRKKAEKALHKSNRALKMLSLCNRTVVHAVEEGELLAKICRIVVEVGGYSLAWVGMAEEGPLRCVVPVAQAGFEGMTLEDVVVTWDSAQTGNGPTGTAIRTGSSCIIRDVPNDPCLAPWREHPVWLGCRSALSQPLVVEGRVIGALSIYSVDPEAFDGEELELLKELAEDLAYAIGVLRGRIRHRETEESLRRSEEKFRTLFHNTSDAIFIHDIHGRVLEANQAAVNCLGYSHDHLLRLSIADVEAPQARWAGRVEALSKRGGIAFESTYLTRGGTPVPVEVVSQPIEFDGRLAILSTARDITERRRARDERNRLEEHLRRAQKMEAIGTLAGGIAHDFNNILGAILGYAEIMEVFDVPKDSPLYSNVREVIKAAHRARELVRQILTFSRQTETEPRPVEVGLIVKEVLKFLRASLPSTIEIHRSLEAKTTTILADPTKIHQLLMNLCTNAGHAMTEKGGTLRVDVAETVLDDEAKECFPDLGPGAYLRLTVSDTGHGMTPEIVERIFDPYFTTKRRGEGTGLGLSIVHGIVKSYGGGIAVESAPGKGSVFRILFPRVEEGRAVEAEVDRGLLPKGDERILMVDDEAALARTGARILERLGYRVTAITSSLDALNVFRADPGAFDLLVTDLTMPQMTGTELARELLGIRPGLPVILCTGYSRKIAPSEAEEAGIRRIIDKPFGVRHLAEAVRNVLDGNGA